MSNYTATIVELKNVRKHSNADRLQCVGIFGNNIIVGLDAKDGDIGIYFPLESQISEVFAAANDLVRRKDENGKPAGGMFDKNRRVRCQTFRGEKSMGFWMPLSALEKTFEAFGAQMPTVAVGDEFEDLAGVQISCKYVVPTNKQQSSGGNGKKAKKKPKSKLIQEQFNFHFDTAQLGKNIHRVSPDDLISVSWKMHGTSAITSHILCKRQVPWYERILSKLGVKVVEEEYDYIYSSRRVVKNDRIKESNHFYGMDLWSTVGDTFVGNLRKGESIYYEIVGYTPEGKMIQKGFDYGCKEGEYDVYIYRITHTNADGHVIELPWDQVVKRATEIGYQACPTIFHGRAKDLFPNIPVDENWNDEFLKRLGETYVYDQDSQFCVNKVPEEGVIVRIEGQEITNLKLKAFRFLQKESELLDSGELDMESEESVEEAA